MSSGNHNAHIACVTCTPMAKVTGPRGDLIYDPISPLWHRARMGLSYGTNVNTVEICVDGLEIGDARSRVAARCLDMAPRPLFLFFLDSDVIPGNDAYLKLFYHLKMRPEIDVAAGIYVCKGAVPFEPLIYQDSGLGAFWDFAVGDILTTQQHNIRAVHMGLTLIRVSLFQRLKDEGLVHGDGTDQDDEPFFCTQNFRRNKPGGGVETLRGTEDIYLFHKARNLKMPCQILVDTSVLAGHHDKSTGITYGLPSDTAPIERAKWLPLPDGSGLRKDRKEANEHTVECEACCGARMIGEHADHPCPECKGTGKVKRPLKLAIDLGAGESRREWPGHITYRLDARRESQPDYCQSLPVLNLPDDHYDLVASRHTAEHVGRWEQEKLWSEMFRICKPGGSIEIIVPNLEWAARKIAAGEVDTHVLSVLYGSQELEEEIGRGFNSHFFGYTKNILRALAEGAGFVDVEVVDWQDDPSLGYHMIGKGQKPGGDSDAKREKADSVERNGEADAAGEVRNGDSCESVAPTQRT